MADLLLIELPGDAGLRLMGRLPTNQRSQLPGHDGLGGKKAGRPVLLMTSGRRTRRTICPCWSGKFGSCGPRGTGGPCGPSFLMSMYRCLTDQADRTDLKDQMDRTDRTDWTDRTDHIDQTDHTGQTDWTDQTDQMDWKRLDETHGPD